MSIFCQILFAIFCVVEGFNFFFTITIASILATFLAIKNHISFIRNSTTTIRLSRGYMMHYYNLAIYALFSVTGAPINLFIAILIVYEKNHVSSLPLTEFNGLALMCTVVNLFGVLYYVSSIFASKLLAKH